MKTFTLRRHLLLSAAALALGAGAAQAQDCPIKIGALAPLSAPGTVVGGEAMRDAMMIAQDDLNAAGGVLGCDIEVVLGDSEGLPERAVAVMERLITQDGVVAVGGGYHSSVGVASKDVADARGIPVVFAETWNDTITGDKQKYIFRIAPLSSWTSNVIWQFALTLPGIEKVVILTENTDYGIPASQETARGLEENGVASTIFSVDIGTQDYAGIVERIKAEDPDMIITLVTGEAAFNFTQQAADAGIGPLDLPFQTGQDALESGTYWTNVPDGQYAFVQRIGVPESQFTEKGKAFAAVYKEKTGKSDVESYAMEAYDSIAILAQAIEEAGSTDGDAIVTALENISHEGTLGRIYFDYGLKRDPSEDEKGDEWWHQWPDPAITIIQFQEEGQASSEAAIVYPEAYKTADPVWVND
ncbi:Leucine-, isoleucine-, valine-, threonine-, and alanine-binding protein [Roseibaca ekhonensis]|uniref:Leucine-, isoleucine-, valine-, threonine-, and alanine-binding protein n=1 Tax=Roseinatronobacter ekhonensis TaxID=254356 RepID=A0A3B0M4L6_9RHOB|nr:ABC transporter substrate-binding protein [Roseibaca ekhonensis]SUZ30972.1 Leucine-, isoleucine-, valine-, threonine-, and alanine-binding protein [Roseibaca ekhonensis]